MFWNLTDVLESWYLEWLTATKYSHTASSQDSVPALRVQCPPLPVRAAAWRLSWFNFVCQLSSLPVIIHTGRWKCLQCSPEGNNLSAVNTPYRNTFCSCSIFYFALKMYNTAQMNEHWLVILTIFRKQVLHKAATNSKNLCSLYIAKNYIACVLQKISSRIVHHNKYSDAWPDMECR